MNKSAFAPQSVVQLRTLHDWVLVHDMQFDERFTQGGIVLLNDNGKGTGIRPRWGQVTAVGPEQQDVSPGQWICVAHGRWTRGLEIEDAQGKKTVRKVDPSDILLVSDCRPQDDSHSDALHVESKSR
jgi:co-chaperonin GroES (HSP10)